VYFCTIFILISNKFVPRTVVNNRKHYFCVRDIEPWNNLNCATVDFSSLRRFRCFIRRTENSMFSKLQLSIFHSLLGVMQVVAEYHPLITCSIPLVLCFCVYANFLMLQDV